ncbi:TVP38/TMEM64 family protein [Arsukibacterium indicum]|uniref:TVP38/TMEM64 family membrane protein n=1 Tax=Arsukibacterium indicum TaxID=2848612 RepID=A0ABS6MQC0_9GAMM|nr:TVP38/TMEM64 family protein [Arsukibacterium indicum]MBV2130930.1 TVP38/TMEM64 family protein [Arsukibacterium indicum]
MNPVTTDSNTATRPQQSSSTKKALLGMAGSVLFVGVVLGLLVFFGIHTEVLKLLEWFKQQGAWAPLLFMLIMAAVVVLLLPGALFTIGAGFVFGVVQGSVYVVLGTTLGATVAFLLARYTFGNRARQFITARAKLQLVNEELTRNDWKIVLLTRLIPFFPSKIANYFFGLTQFTLHGYIAGSLVGFIPFTVHNVYLGSLVADITTFEFGEQQRSGWEWALYLGGFVAAVAAVIYLNRLANRALAKYTRQNTDKEPSV